MKLVTIADPEMFEDEAAFINCLFEAGMEVFHLRKPGQSKESLAILLEAISPAFYPKIALHQHHDLAEWYGIRRLHFPEQDRMMTDAKQWQEYKAAGYTISTSIHQPCDVDRVTAFDYVFLGPVFDSISKAGYKSTIPGDFRLQKTAADLQVIALGGINAHNIRKAEAMRFDGVAVIGAIWNNRQTAVSTFKKLHHICRSVPMY